MPASPNPVYLRRARVPRHRPMTGRTCRCEVDRGCGGTWRQKCMCPQTATTGTLSGASCVSTLRPPPASRRALVRARARASSSCSCSCAPGIGLAVPVAVAQAVAADAKVLDDARARARHCVQRRLEQPHDLRVCATVVDHLPHDANPRALRAGAAPVMGCAAHWAARSWQPHTM